MGTITVRNLDDGIIDQLKAQASANNRSLEAEVRDLLSRTATQRERPSVRELIELVDKVAAMTPNVPQTDSVDILRELRDDR